MQLLRIFTNSSSRGFSLLEMLVVMSIMTMLGGIGLIVSMESFRGYAFRSERDQLLMVLTKARNQSINNMCLGGGCTGGESHGVKVVGDTYVLFQGRTYATRDVAVDEVVVTNFGGISRSGTDEIVFAQLSGDVDRPGVIALIDQSGHASDITINREGSIRWSN